MIGKNKLMISFMFFIIAVCVISCSESNIIVYESPIENVKKKITKRLLDDNLKFKNINTIVENDNVGVYSLFVTTLNDICYIAKSIEIPAIQFSYIAIDHASCKFDTVTMYRIQYN